MASHVDPQMRTEIRYKPRLLMKGPDHTLFLAGEEEDSVGKAAIPRYTTLMIPKRARRRPAPSRQDEKLGLNRSITRRDFFYGLPALAGVLAACRSSRGSAGQPAGVVEAQAMRGGFELGPDWYGPGGVGDYAASHGNTPEVLKVAHELRDGRFDSIGGQ